jgi:hypothetical protein
LQGAAVTSKDPPRLPFPPVPSFRPAAALRSPAVRAILGYWTARRAGVLLPDSASIDLGALANLRDNLSVLEVAHDPLRFTFAVHAPRATAYLGRDMTGLTVDDYPDPEYGVYVRCCAERATRTRNPAIMVEHGLVTAARIYRLECAALPLASGDRPVDRLLIGIALLH